MYRMHVTVCHVRNVVHATRDTSKASEVEDLCEAGHGYTPVVDWVVLVLKSKGGPGLCG